MKNIVNINLHVSQSFLAPTVYALNLIRVFFFFQLFCFILRFFIRLFALIFFAFAFCILVSVLSIVFIHVVLKTILTNVVLSTVGTVKLFTLTYKNVVTTAITFCICMVVNSIFSYLRVAVMKRACFVFLAVALTFII